MPAQRGPALLLVRKADLHEERAGVLLLLEHLPEAIGRPRVTAVRDRGALLVDDERARIDGVCDLDGANSEAGDLDPDFRLEDLVSDRRCLLRRDDGEVGPDEPIEEV